ncbi:hypothetical protein BKA67DRAFT_194086 [Truncatella angustata]|uniref:Uncharacterized protein n=1 Tax=Truncatella angustata TaxID=152316 RepID=A0A9P8URG6_9PEZI|nr:uncharacterized protein BKA67DRAFT_194086 [Truncatella angustata]KAH6657640.1 hypothetical protein BKA67DRAFT_194086 [Truncatella angustata]
MQLINTFLTFIPYAFAQNLRLPIIKTAPAGATICPKYSRQHRGETGTCYPTRFLGINGNETSYTRIKFDFPPPPGILCAVFAWFENNCTRATNLTITETTCADVSQIRSYSVECPEPLLA